MSQMPAPNNQANQGDELERFHPSYCDKYEVLRGIYPNDRRETGKPCSCGFETAIENYATKQRIDELESLGSNFMYLDSNDGYKAKNDRIAELEATLQEPGNKHK